MSRLQSAAFGETGGGPAWDIAEATLGDGSRWREILEANPALGNVDLVPSGTTLNISGDDREITVVKGDNLWKLAAVELKEAHGDRPSNAEIVPYWRDVIETNVEELRSGDPDLIYPGETIDMPGIDGDRRTKGSRSGGHGASASFSAAGGTSDSSDHIASGQVDRDYDATRGGCDPENCGGR